jgi:cobalamin biosynthesis Mg chelatase CobN
MKVVHDALPENYTVLQRRRRRRGGNWPSTEKSSFIYSREEANFDQSKRGAYIDEMEDRIKRMESAIISSGLHVIAEPEEGKEEEKSSSDKIESQAALSNHLSNLVIDPNGSPNFIGIL